MANTGQRWNERRTAVLEHGGPPALIELVSGRLTLRNMEPAAAVQAHALDGAGRPIGEPYAATQTSAG